ncbi:hypothetical protein [Streptosporangium sp. NPDC049644]|uniref:hypothetical protein n=1 Tax=Streptosporangium sp. NPDC049644 TaxID=3155507 RepID=UPI0034318209
MAAPLSRAVGQVAPAARVSAQAMVVTGVVVVKVRSTGTENIGVAPEVASPGTRRSGHRPRTR